MPSSASTRLRVEIQARGENRSSWGDTRLNEALKRLEEAIADTTSISLTGLSAYDLTSGSRTANYVADESRAAVLQFTGTPSGNVSITTPNTEKLYLVDNQTAFTLTFTRTGGGTGVTCRAGVDTWIYCDGTRWWSQDTTLDKVATAVANVALGGNKLTGVGTATNATDAATLSNKVHEFAAPTAALAMNSQKITGLADGSLASQDAATVNQVTTLINQSVVGLPVQSGNSGKFLTTNGSTPSWNSTPLAVVNGGTGGGTAAAARSGILPAYASNTLRFLRVNAGETDVEWAANSSGYAQIGQTTISVAAATITFTGIAQTFSDLLIIATGLSHDAGANRIVRVALSDDGGTTYSATPMEISASVAATVNLYGAVFIPGYNRGASVVLGMLSDLSANLTFGSGSALFVQGARHNSGVNAIRLSLNTTGNFDAGTVTLYAR